LVFSARNAWTIIKGVVQTAMALIQGIIRIATSIIQGNWSQAWNQIKDLIRTVAGIIGQTLSTLRDRAVNTIMNLVNGVTGWSNKLRTKTKKIYNAIREYVISSINNIVTGVSSAIDSINKTVM